MKPLPVILILLTAANIIAAEKKIIRDTDRFELVYTMKLPELNASGKLWIPLARTDPYQRFETLSISSPIPWHKTRDKIHHNEILVLHPDQTASGQQITIRYLVTRKEKSAHTETGNPKKHLKAEKLVPINARFIRMAKKITATSANDLDKGKAIYKHVLEHMRYDKSGKGWGRGDALYACDSRTGNCTDFHAYFIGLCRAANIPARFAIGFTIPANVTSGNIGGYHCWAEFYAQDKWVPVDISEADKHPELAAYYFGHHPANRLELSRGRDILPKPSPKAGPFNYLFGPHLEVAGKAVPLKATYEFKRLPLKN